MGENCLILHFFSHHCCKWNGYGGSIWWIHISSPLKQDTYAHFYLQNTNLPNILMIVQVATCYKNTGYIEQNCSQIQLGHLLYIFLVLEYLRTSPRTPLSPLTTAPCIILSPFRHNVIIQLPIVFFSRTNTSW